MSDGKNPKEEDFTKTLSLVLLCELLVVVSARAIDLFLDGGPGGGLATFVAASLFATILASNLATLGIAWRWRRDEGVGRFAMTSFFMTACLTVVLAAVWFVRSLAGLEAVSAATFVAILVTLVFAPGSMLRLPP